MKAFRRRVLDGARNLEAPERAVAILKAGKAVASSPSLRARESEITDEFTRRLAQVLGRETDVETVAAAAAMMATHRALVERTRQQVAAGKRGRALSDDFKAQARRAFALIERGLGGYAVRP